MMPLKRTPLPGIPAADQEAALADCLRRVKGQVMRGAQILRPEPFMRLLVSVQLSCGEIIQGLREKLAERKAQQAGGPPADPSTPPGGGVEPSHEPTPGGGQDRSPP